MRPPKHTIAAACCLAAALGAAPPRTGAEDWPQFGGLGRDFTSPETGLARSWPDAGPKKLWTVPLNAGFSGAAVVGGEVFILDRVDNKQDVLLCVDLATGKELWRFANDARGRVSPPGARATPAVDRDNVYVTGPLGDFYCVSRKTHQAVWTAHLVNDFAGKLPQWNVAQNPALYGQLVIVAPQGRGAGVAAFAKATGKVAWTSPCLPGMITGGWEGSYVSPVLTEIAGVPQAVVVTAQGKKVAGAAESKGLLAGVSLADGTVLWRYDGWQCDLPIPAPAVAGQGRIFISAAYDAGSAMIEITRSGQDFAVRELYKTTECGTQIQQPVVHEGHIYAVSNGKERKEGLVCLSLDGKLKWHTTNSKYCSKAKPGLPNFDCGNLLIADGLIYIVDGAAGDLYLLRADPEAYKQLACAKGCVRGGKAWAPMALSDGRLLVRDQRGLTCLDIRAGAGGS